MGAAAKLESYKRDSSPLQPFRLVSMWDVLRFYADRFVALIKALELTRSALTLALVKSENPGLDIPRSIRPAIQFFRELGEILDGLDLKMSAISVGRAISLIQEGTDPQAILSQIVEIERRIQDELQEPYFFSLLLGKKKYYNPPEPLFGMDVADRFPSAIPDIEEAGNCFALARYTACVFHCMRVIEIGLLSISRSIGIANSLSSWNYVVDKIDKELKKNYEDREFKGDYDFWAGVSAHMHAVKIAWRNQVMHVDKLHDENTALNILNSTIAFMQHISIRL